MKKSMIIVVLLVVILGPLAAQISREYPLFLKDDWKHPDHIFVPLTVKCKPPLMPYVVTIPRTSAHWETCAEDRVHALMSISPTVFTKEEWDEGAKLEKEFPVKTGDAK